MNSDAPDGSAVSALLVAPLCYTCYKPVKFIFGDNLWMKNEGGDYDHDILNIFDIDDDCTTFVLS